MAAIKSRPLHIGAHALALILFTLNCRSAPAAELPSDDWEPVPESELPRLTPDGSLRDFRLAISRQLEACDEYDKGKVSRCGDPTPPPEARCHRPTLQKLAALAKQSSDWREFYAQSKRDFQWYRSLGKEGSREGVFTGFNNPTFDGSLVPTEKYRFPLYAKPDDLVKIQDPSGQTQWRRRMPDGSLGPYFSRKEIDVDKALAGKGLEIAHLDDLVSVLRLQIEGSGTLRLHQRDGSTRDGNLNFAAKNGLVGTSVFTYLKKKGVDSKYLSFDGLRQYFKDFPGEVWPTLTASPSYVFFRLSDEPACGTAAVYLTPGHSIAVDPKSLPLGAVVLFDTERPQRPKDGGEVKYLRFTRFAVAQDTGQAIKGPGRVDVYWGTDDYAEFASSNMKASGKLYVPILKSKISH